MRFTAAAASVLAFATTVLAADPWKNLGGDFALIGPSFNSSFKAGDTIPLEYAFYTMKMVNTNSTNTNTTAPTVNNGQVTLTSLTWIGATGDQTVEVAPDNGRNTGYSAVCLASDVCIGNYYPKRIELAIPADSYASNYTLVIGYSLKHVGTTNMSYKFPFNIVPASANVTSPVALIPSAPAVKATLPVYAPKSSGLVNKASKAVIGTTMVLASAMLLL
ncbi:hypothetical protein BGX29_008051 [Mortierella sp. GBA35]|nr:hypothetical protein BGX23_009635 [Mortierella sp. AD031]KAF9097541.1 hypothetical protein BGX29_008051 [Mortierella sp. GBA35]KAG0200700.1 hypothetical protein BGX33_010829 [Mortierella sp. NVP41]